MGTEFPKTEFPKAEFPKTGALDLLKLLGSVGWRWVRRWVRRRGSFAFGPVFLAWYRDAARRHGSANLRVGIGSKRLLLVGDRGVAEHVLRPVPGVEGYVAGSLKRKAMAFLAPGALTIADGERWQRLRRFNEAVLEPGQVHPMADVFAMHVRDAFSTPVRDLEDVRARMGQVMEAIVFGGDVPEGTWRLSHQAFAAVQSPVKRMLRKRTFAKTVRTLHDTLVERWRATQENAGVGATGLLAHACPAEKDLSDTEVVDQIPHWMFTFTASGADLLARTLGMVQSRPKLLRSVREEVETAGASEGGSGVHQLRLTEACVRETGRLFSPVARTFLTASQDDVAGDRRIPAGTELMLDLSILQESQAKERRFVPQDWLNGSNPYSQVFLSGARSCPGQDLIVFVCKAAIAAQVRCGLSPKSTAVSTDPLPVAFPGDALRFSAANSH